VLRTLIVAALVIISLTMVLTSPILIILLWTGTYSPLFGGLMLLYGLACLLGYTRTKNRLLLPHILFSLGNLLLLTLVFTIQGRLLPAFVPFTPVRSVAYMAAVLAPIYAPVLIAIAGGVLGEPFSRRLVHLLLCLISLCVLFGPLARPQRRLFILPAGYSGEVRIQLDDPSCPGPPYSSGDWIYEIPPSGELCAYLPDLRLGEETWIFADKPTKTYAPDETASSPIQGEGTEPDPKTPDRVIYKYKVTLP
jgi:hypothetical protein